MSTFHTIGHSTHSTEEFIALLQDAGVAWVADIRTVPASRANPQFQRETLQASLQSAGIGYRWLRELGGLRPKSKLVARECNGFWQNDSFHNYADYALSDAFGQALAELIKFGTEQPCALMCAEAVWWRCHRRIVADYLLARGHEVIHILGRGHHEAARRTPESVILPDLRLHYPQQPLTAAASRAPAE